MRSIAPSMRPARALWIRTAVLSAALGLIAACAQQVIVPARGPITFGAITFAPPPGSGWMQLERSAEHVVFGRHEPALDAQAQAAEAPAIDLTAWVKVVRSTRPVNGYATLHAIVVRMTDQIDRNRFELNRHVVEPIDTPETMCVRRSMLLDDLRSAARAPGAPVTMRMVDVLCRDPSRADTIYAIHVSERAARLRPLDIAGSLSEQWLALMRFTAAPDRAP